MPQFKAVTANTKKLIRKACHDCIHQVKTQLQEAFQITGVQIYSKTEMSKEIYLKQRKQNL